MTALSGWAEPVPECYEITGVAGWPGANFQVVQEHHRPRCGLGYHHIPSALLQAIGGSCSAAWS